jgi:hypothetical protein
LDKGLTETEAKFKIECHLMNTERAYITKYGEVEGKLEYRKRKEKEGKASPKKIEYWIKRGLSEAEAKEKISNNQKTFTLKKCIEKYGEENGKKIHAERQKKWQKTLYRNGNLKSGYSQISQTLFFEIVKYYGDIESLNLVFFAKKSGEYIMLSDENFYRFDFTDLKNKKIIEFNGDDYHANPTKYKSTDTPNPFRNYLTSSEIWEKDRKKTELANENGFDVLTVWESDYRKNKEDVLKKCLQFLNIKTNV